MTEARRPQDERREHYGLVGGHPYALGPTATPTATPTTSSTIAGSTPP
jgi:hypothetical protein